MEDAKLKRATEPSSSTVPKRQRHEGSNESPSEEHESGEKDSSEKMPSESGENSGPSASDAYVIGNNYYVFLNFRGLDTRNGFTDHLYHKLLDVGLRLPHPNFVFRDDEKLRYGESIAIELLSAIKRSKVSIPIISENYAASQWCLRELIEIMDCKLKGQQKVYPVLYKVTTDDVKKEDGKFAQVFQSNLDHFDKEVKERGLKALREAVSQRVFVSEKECGGREGELVKKIVETIMSVQLQDFLPSLPKDSVGIDDHVARIMNLADARTMKSANTISSEARIIVIYGIGGVGKTTLAKAIYKKLVEKFIVEKVVEKSVEKSIVEKVVEKVEYRSSFLEDIRETIESKGMKHVQSLHYLNLSKYRAERDLGIASIREICNDQKVIIFLDDVDRQDHLDNLIGGCNFALGSWIIITCRDKALLKLKYMSYELKEMNLRDSLVLFSRHAFEEQRPPTKLLALSHDIVASTGGLPLALVTIGSSLKNKDESIWKEMLKKLSKVPHKDVRQKLKISYDLLEYEEQQMFLDIACFFIGIKKTIAAYLWEDLEYYVDYGLDRIIELSLIDDNDEFRMHDQLRDLGKAIACPANKNPWKCSRLWDKRAMTIQRSEVENRYIEALRLDENGSNMFMTRKSFKRMPYLKFLHLSKVNFVEDFEDSLSELRWLKWEECPNSFEAINIRLEKLVVLDLSGGNINEHWGGWSKMERLKVLNLSRCTALKRTPSLSMFESLEMLILEFCGNLEEIDPSIGDVKCLTSLNLTKCWKLKKLPSRLGELKGLVSLNLSCSGLQGLPEAICELEKLKKLTIDGAKIKEIPRSIGSLKELEILSASGSSLVGLPESIGQLKKLKELTISGTRIEEIPPSISFLEKLERLYARCCESLVELPESISQLTNLLTLDLRFCFKFKGFPESIGSLVKLQCLLLGNIPPPELEGDFDRWEDSDKFCFDRIPRSIGKLESLTELHLTCAQISELPESIGELKELKILKISRCEKLSSLPSTISKLGKLEELDAIECDCLQGRVPIDGLSSLKILRLGKISDFVEIFAYPMCQHQREERPSLEDFEYLSSGVHLDLTKCHIPTSLTILEVTCHNCTLPELSHLIHLEELNLQFCEFLVSIPVLPSRILRLWIFWCGKLRVLPDLSSLELLSELRIVGCSELEEISGLEGLKSLEILSICERKKLSNLKGLEQLESLINLEMIEAPLFQVQCLGRLKNLKKLSIDSCQSLISFDISQLTHVLDLSVIDCKKIVKIICLERLKNLRSMNIRRCDSIKTLPDLSLFDNLEYLSIYDCPKLHDVRGEVKSVTWVEDGEDVGRRRMNSGRSNLNQKKEKKLREVREPRRSRRLNSTRR